MCDTNDGGSGAQFQLEEEMDKIIMLADSFVERATRQSLSAKRPNGLKSPRRNFLLVHKPKQKKGQSRCVAKVPSRLHKRQRLSPLAARAALAAAVTPLRQARQVIFFEQSSAKSARCKVCAGCMVVTEDDPSDLHVFLGEEDRYISMAVAATNRGYCSSMKETGSTHVHRCVCDVTEKTDVELIIDIPIYEDLLLKNAIDFTIDIPISNI